MYRNDYSNYNPPYEVIDVRETRPISITQVLGLLSFMFLAMAAGAFFVPPTYFIPAVILEFVLLFVIPLINRRDTMRGNDAAAGLTGALALLFAACSGAALSPLIQGLVATPTGLAVLGQAALVTFVVFAAVGLYGVLTRRNLGVLSKGLSIGLFVLLGIMILRLFFSSFFSPFALLIGLGGAVLFSLLTAFDFQRMKNSSADEAVLVTLNIFLDFVNLFTFILDIFLMFGGFGGRRD